MVDQTESEILHYDESVTKDTVKADIKAKYYLNNNISDDIKRFKNIKSPIRKKKCNYLYAAFPNDLIIDSNMISYHGENEMINPKSKHIDIRCHYTSELIKQNLANDLVNDQGVYPGDNSLEFDLTLPPKNNQFDSLILNRTSHRLHYDCASQFYVYMPEAGCFLPDIKQICVATYLGCTVNSNFTGNRVDTGTLPRICESRRDDIWKFKINDWLKREDITIDENKYSYIIGAVEDGIVRVLMEKEKEKYWRENLKEDKLHQLKKIIIIPNESICDFNTRFLKLYDQWNFDDKASISVIDYENPFTTKRLAEKFESIINESRVGNEMWSSYTTNIKNNYNSVTNYVQIERSNYKSENFKIKFKISSTNSPTNINNIKDNNKVNSNNDKDYNNINNVNENIINNISINNIINNCISNLATLFLTLNRTSHPLHYDRASQFYVYMPEAGGFLCIVNTRAAVLAQSVKDNTLVSKRHSLGSILDPAPILIWVNSSYSDARAEMNSEVWRGDAVLVCQYITFNNYICYGHNERWISILTCDKCKSRPDPYTS
ncbi:hypothetical protein H8356DRAFT_1328925 [Neocallimastix lanati (nom. inval.)]|nr:hypothetical protein H8356DRAFT_1328925 [Neocallimastix sp. JGI-2020a]